MAPLPTPPDRRIDDVPEAADDKNPSSAPHETFTTVVEQLATINGIPLGMARTLLQSQLGGPPGKYWADVDC